MKHFEAIQTALERIAGARRLREGGADEAELQGFAALLTQLDGHVRETIQEETADRALAVIRKLETGARLGEDDLELIRLWMVSDAEFYVQLENDHPNWEEELGRLADVLGGHRRSVLTLENLGRIRGTLRDALRVVQDLVYFEQQKRRIRDFEAAIRRLGREDRLALARLLQQKLESDAM